MMRASPSRHIWKPLCAWLLLFLGLGSFAGCPTQVIELDPAWRADASNPEAPGDTQPESAPEQPGVCNNANSTEFALVSPLTREGMSLLHGILGPAAANTTLYIAHPPGWTTFPASVKTDDDGRYGFLIDRNKQKEVTDNTIYIYTSNGFCRSTLPPLSDGKLPSNKLELPSPQPCPRGTIASLIVQVKGELKTSLVVASTIPHIASFQQLTRSFDKGRTLYDLRINCHTPGTTSLLLGSPELESAQITIQVQ